MRPSRYAGIAGCAHSPLGAMNRAGRSRSQNFVDSPYNAGEFISLELRPLSWKMHERGTQFPPRLRPGAGQLLAMTILVVVTTVCRLDRKVAEV